MAASLAPEKAEARETELAGTAGRVVGGAWERRRSENVAELRPSLDFGHFSSSFLSVCVRWKWRR